MALETTVLPFRGEQFSFGLLSGKAQQDITAQVDLACICFDINGKVVDSVHGRKPTALDGAIVTSAEPSLLPEGLIPAAGDDVVHVFPKKFERAVEVLVFVASTPKLPSSAHDLSFAQQLVFTITWTDLEGNIVVKETDLKPHTGNLAMGGDGASVNSLMIATVFLDESGWTIRSAIQGSAHDSYGLLIPQMKAAIISVKTELGIQLDAANRLAVEDPDSDEPVVATRRFEDRSLCEAASLRQSSPTPVTKLRLDVGWATYPPKKNEEGEDEELEETEMAFTLVFYNLEGEEVFSVSADNTEADGVKVGRDPPEEEEEAEEPPAEEEAEGEGGEEGAEGAVAPPPPEKPKEDPYAFPAKEVIFIELAALPKEARAALLIVSNYGGAGMTHVRTVRARLFDASAGDVGAGLLADFGVDSKYGADKAISQVALFKLYKQYTDGAFAMFGGSGTPNLAAFVEGGQAVKDALKAYAEVQKKANEAAAAVAKAIEAGDAEETTTDSRPSEWRYCALGLCMQGGSLEDAEHDIKNALSFDGPLEAGASRSHAYARVQFANRDSYFGGYQDDLKSGPGIYTFATGAAYVGMYAAGQRSGQGYMILPDGGTYEGSFAADKFDGQGQYRYPDGSVYTGSWGGGLKHGAGVYWDTSGGCQRGSWVKGILQGEAEYDQPAYSFKGEFVRGVPAGPATFIVCPHRSLDLPQFAASHIVAPGGPTLSMTATYAIPPGSGKEPALDEEGQPIVDEEGPQLPTFPKYDGLTFESAVLPDISVDCSFPPVQGLPVPLIKPVPTFTAVAGLVA